jgi:hypothetical protein
MQRLTSGGAWPGVGTGTSHFKVDPTGIPTAFHFGLVDCFHSVPIAIGRIEPIAPVGCRGIDLAAPAVADKLDLFAWRGLTGGSSHRTLPSVSLRRLPAELIGAAIVPDTMMVEVRWWSYATC